LGVEKKGKDEGTDPFRVIMPNLEEGVGRFDGGGWYLFEGRKSWRRCAEGVAARGKIVTGGGMRDERSESIVFGGGVAGAGRGAWGGRRARRGKNGKGRGKQVDIIRRGEESQNLG